MLGLARWGWVLHDTYFVYTKVGAYRITHAGALRLLLFLFFIFKYPPQFVTIQNKNHYGENNFILSNMFFGVADHFSTKTNSKQITVTFCGRQRLWLLGIGNWELGIGNWLMVNG